MACSIISALLYLYCRSGCRADVVASALTFHPPSSFYDFEEVEGGEGQWKLVLSSELRYPKFDNQLLVRLLTSKNKTRVPVLCFRMPGAKLTIIFSHGNATDIGAMYILFFMIAHSCNVNVVGYDYTGYGASAQYGVRPTERQTYQDIETVYDWCCSNDSSASGDSPLVTDPKTQIVVYGQSLGSGPSCFIAARRPVAGLVLHSPILSGIRVLTPSRALWCFDIFPNIDWIKKVKCKTFVIHGENDVEVRVHHGKQLHAAVSPEFQTEPWWVPERGHNDLMQGNEKQYFARMTRFLDEVENPQHKVLVPRKTQSQQGSSTQYTSASLTASPAFETENLVGEFDSDADTEPKLAAGRGLVKIPRGGDSRGAYVAAGDETSASTTAAIDFTDDDIGRTEDADTTVLPDTPSPSPSPSPSSEPPSLSIPEPPFSETTGSGVGVESPAAEVAAGDTWQGVDSVRKPLVGQELLPAKDLVAVNLSLARPDFQVGYAGKGVDERSLLQGRALDNKGGSKK